VLRVSYSGAVTLVSPYRGIAPRLGPGVFLADNCRVIGDVELEAEVSIWYGAVLRGDVGKIRIGARSNVQDNATVHMTYGVSDARLGQEVIVGHNAVIHGAIIDDRALVGMGAVVMDNAHLEPGAWLAAGSVLPPNARGPAGQLLRGSPAKPVRPVTEQEAEWARGAIERYLQLARDHAQQG